MKESWKNGKITKKRLPQFKEDLEPLKPKDSELENRLGLFVHNPTFSDITLVNQIKNQATYKVHRVVVASGSKYLNRVFKWHPHMKVIELPVPTLQNNEKHSDDQIARILKYMYNNQDFESIKEEVTKANIYSLYSHAYFLECEKLCEDLQNHILNELLHLDTVAHFLQEAIEFQMPAVLQETTNLLLHYYQHCYAADPGFMSYIPNKEFVQLL